MADLVFPVSRLPKRQSLRGMFDTGVVREQNVGFRSVVADPEFSKNRDQNRFAVIPVLQSSPALHRDAGLIPTNVCP